MMTYRDRSAKHQALLLLGCAFGFVYLLAWQFQGSQIQEQWSELESHRSGSPISLPKKLKTNIANNDDSLVNNTNTDTPTSNLVTQTNPSTNSTVSHDLYSMPGFKALNAVPQSFMRLGLGNNIGIMIDDQRVVVTTQTNNIKRSGDTKRFSADEVSQLKLNADAVTFYNDPSWANILVVIEVSNNEQSLLMQIPYPLRRDDRSYINKLITQLTQQ